MLTFLVFQVLSAACLLVHLGYSHKNTTDCGLNNKHVSLTVLETCKPKIKLLADPFTGEDTLPVSQAESSQSGRTWWNGQGSSQGPLF